MVLRIGLLRETIAWQNHRVETVYKTNSNPAHLDEQHLSLTSEHKDEIPSSNINTFSLIPKMPSFQTIICAILAISAPLAAASPLPEPELETRQSLSAIRFWVNKDYSGAWADLSIANIGKCGEWPCIRRALSQRVRN